MKEQWDTECTELRAGLAALQKRLHALEARPVGTHGRATPPLHRRLSKQVVMIVLPVVVVLAAGGALYGQGAMDALFIDPQGRVGIGTTGPGEKLQVSGGKIQLDGNQQIKFADSDTSNNLKVQLWTGYGLGINGGTLFYAANGKHSWRDNGGANERMALSTNADGGLTVNGTGTSSFAGNVDVRGRALARSLSFTNEKGESYADNWIGMADNIQDKTKWLHIGGITDGGVRRLALVANTTYAAGKVGIGTSDPQATLEVNGDLKAASINGEKPPVRFEVGPWGTWASVEQDLKAYCADGDGCTIKVFLRHKNGQNRTDLAQIYIPVNGFRGWRRDAYGKEYDFILNDTNKEYNDILSQWGWYWVRNRASNAQGAMVGRPYQGYKVNFMTHPDVTATVIIYDR